MIHSTWPDGEGSKEREEEGHFGNEGGERIPRKGLGVDQKAVGISSMVSFPLFVLFAFFL